MSFVPDDVIAAGSGGSVHDAERAANAAARRVAHHPHLLQSSPGRQGQSVCDVIMVAADDIQFKYTAKLILIFTRTLNVA